MPSVRENPPLRLSLNVQPPSGSGTRWGADEPKPANVPSDLTFSTTAPGGFEGASCTLPRRPNTAYPDLERLSTATITGAGGQIAWEGRIEAAPRVSGDSMAVSPEMVGWQAHLEDNKSARAVYVDRDLSGWTGMSGPRRLAYYGGGVITVVQDGSVQPDTATGAPGLLLTANGRWASGVSSEMWYDAGPGLAISSAYYSYIARVTDAAFTGRLQSATSDAAAGEINGTDVITATNSTGSRTETPSSAQRYVFFQMFYVGAASTDTDRDFRVYNVTVWGDHGLTKRGTAPDDGLYASDVVAHAVSSWAPLLSYSTGTNGSITPSTFIIPQLAFTDPTTAADIISTVNRYHLRDWGVWEGSRAGQPTFYYHDRGARGKAWRARIGPSQLSEQGASMDRLWNGVIVRYQDVDGSTKTVGPSGAGADTTSSSVADTDPLNPANKLGIRRWTTLDMGGVSTAAGATEVGRRFLEETKQLDTSGQAQIVGHCEDDRGVKRPAWQIRAGDTISFVDAADTSPRRVVKTTYSDATKTNSVDLDAPPDGLAALLERLQVVLVPLGL